MRAWSNWEAWVMVVKIDDFFFATRPCLLFRFLFVSWICSLLLVLASEVARFVSDLITLYYGMTLCDFAYLQNHRSSLRNKHHH